MSVDLEVMLTLKSLLLALLRRSGHGHQMGQQALIVPATSYTYNSRSGWHAPQNFEFPAWCKLYIGKTLAPGASLEPNCRHRWQSSSCSNLAFLETQSRTTPKEDTIYLWASLEVYLQDDGTNWKLAITENPSQINAQFLEDTFEKQRSISRLEYSTFSTSNVPTATPGRFLPGQSTSRNHKFCMRAQNKEKSFCQGSISSKTSIQHCRCDRPLQYCHCVCHQVIAQLDHWNISRYINLKQKSQSETIMMIFSQPSQGSWNPE